MKLKDARGHYEYFSGQASSLVRQLAFAGIAVVWALKGGVRGDVAVPSDMLLPTMLIVAGLMLTCCTTSLVR